MNRCVQAPVSRSRDSIEPRPPSHATAARAGLKTETVNGDDQQAALECHFRPIVLPPEQPPGDDVIAASRRHIVKTGYTTALKFAILLLIGLLQLFYRTRNSVVVAQS